MKLHYFKARNVLSFGNEEVELEFSPYNVIVGPNDSGKTNLFRALSLVEKAFDYRKPSLDGILFQGDKDKSLLLEVGVKLDKTEIELFSTLIICSEMVRVYSNQSLIQEIKEKAHWEIILKKYGIAIFRKSLRQMSFLLEKDELITSELRMVVKFSYETGSLFLDRHNKFSEKSEDLSSYQPESFVRLIVEDFETRYESLNDIEIKALLQNEEKLSKECPSLGELLIGISDGENIKAVNVSGNEINQLNNTLRGDPIVAKLSHLIQDRRIQLQNVHAWNILQRMYKTSFVRLQEMRTSPPSLDFSSPSQDGGESTIVGNNLALQLFWLLNSGTRSNRVRYNRIKKEFQTLTGSEFDIAIRIRDVKEVVDRNLGFLDTYEVDNKYLNQLDLVGFGLGEESTTRQLNEVYIQIIKHDYPLPIEQTASGLYEILFVLTTIIGVSDKVLLLDEPELHLHPTMQKRILNLLFESRDKSGNQIVLITHSPYLVSEGEIDSTWRFSKVGIATTAHNLGRVLADLDTLVQQKLEVRLYRSDIRSLLFSRGVIFVEGLSDKIALEPVDRHLSVLNEEAALDESEWSVLDISGKNNLSQFMTLSHILGISSVAILDYDALMHRDSKIELNGRELKTSSVVRALWKSQILNESLSQKISSIDKPKSEWYDQSHLEDLISLCLENRIFIFSTDLEGVMVSRSTKKNGKPLKSLERIIELIDKNDIPSEFKEVRKFLRQYTLS